MGKRSSTKPAALPPIAPPTARAQKSKDEEELALEERLFGTKKRRIGDGPSVQDVRAAAAEDEAMDGMHDGELFVIDAPTLDVGEGESDVEFESDAGDVSVDGDEDDDGDNEDVDVEGQERAGGALEGQSDEESEIDYEASSASDSEDEADLESGAESESESDEADEADNDNDVDIQLPTDQYDYAEHQKHDAERKAKVTERRCVWHDPADDLIGVDLSEVRRLKKLARGKREGEGQVGGKELALRLREQCVISLSLLHLLHLYFTYHLIGSAISPPCTCSATKWLYARNQADDRFERIHPRPAWADDRVRRGVPSLSSLFSSTKSFIDGTSSGGGGSSRSAPLPQGTLEVQRLRNANQQNPTTGKKEAVNVKDGVVDFAWHPNPAVPVGAVAGGDRRVRFFHVSDSYVGASWVRGLRCWGVEWR